MKVDIVPRCFSDFLRFVCFAFVLLEGLADTWAISNAGLSKPDAYADDWWLFVESVVLLTLIAAGRKES